MNGVCHRDIKPANILVTQDLTKVCIVDFNVSKKRGQENEQFLNISRTDSGHLSKEQSFIMHSNQRGTVAFAAPERMGINTHYTEKVDMWAAGIVLYMLLTGTYPFDENAQMVASDSQGQEVSPNDMEGLIDTIRNGEEWVNDLLMQDVCSHISEEAKQLIAKLIVKDPNERFSAKQALADPWVTEKTRCRKHMFNAVALMQNRATSRIFVKKELQLERIPMSMIHELLREGLVGQSIKIQKSTSQFVGHTKLIKGNNLALPILRPTEPQKSEVSNIT